MKLFHLFPALCIVWGLTLQAMAADGTRTQPNIVFIFSDDHAYQAISAYNDPRRLLETPGLDRLAKEGMRFDRCLVPNSICGPSRATVLTGKYSHLNGFPNNTNSRFDPEQTTFPKFLRQAGYQTAIIGKWHLVSDPSGFDHWQILPGQGQYYNPPFIRNGERIEERGYVTDVITDRSLEWLKKRDKSRPFLLMSQHKAPHREWSPATRHLGHDRDRRYPEPPTLFEDLSQRGAAVRGQAMTLANHFFPLDVKFDRPGRLTPEQRVEWDAYYGPRNEAFHRNPPEGEELTRWRYNRYMHDYLGTVKAVDESVARLLKYLDNEGLAENTVVVYASDQGFFLGEHGWYDKRWIFEESLRTPLLVRWPGVTPAGSVNSDMVSTVDFAQTFLEGAGVPAPEGMQGRSMVPVLRGETPADWRKSFYYHYYEYPESHNVRPHYGVVTERYKLVHFYAPDVDYWELYDLQKDPRELQSFHGRPEYAETERELRRELARLRAELKVPDPDPPGFSGNAPAAPVSRKISNTEALHLDFTGEAEGEIPDVSSSRIPGKISGVLSRVQGRAEDSKARSFDGNSAVEIPPAPALNPADGPWTVEVMLEAESSDGVVLARGGGSHGYALHLEDGKPVFSVRIDGRLYKVTGTHSILKQWTQVTGVITAGRALRLLVDGKREGETALPGFIARNPAEAMQIGKDAGSLVGEYPESGAFQGAVERVILFNGERPAEALSK